VEKRGLKNAGPNFRNGKQGDTQNYSFEGLRSKLGV